MSEKLTRLISGGKSGGLTFSRDEVKAMVEIGKDEGVFNQAEHKIFTNLMKIRHIPIRKIMTPRTVIFSVSQDVSVGDFFTAHGEQPFSRIPLFRDNHDDLIGYILKVDILTAQAKDEHDRKASEFLRPFVVFSDTITAFEAYNKLIHDKSHIALVVDEYGTVQGLVTLEDIFETIIGLEITDELDTVEDMQVLAQDQWAKRKAKIAGGSDQGS
jgi:CBS domain containing-hemolysin-like protein